MIQEERETVSKTKLKNQKRRQKAKTAKTVCEIKTAIDKIPTIYCISLKSRQDRRQRMEHRFKTNGLIEKVKFLDATAIGDPIIDKYAKNNMPRGSKQVRSDYILNYDAVYGCFISHLRALQEFVNSTEAEAIIIEDDVMMRDTFVTDFPVVHANIPPETGVILLSYILATKNFELGGIDPSKKNLLKANKNSTWGTQMYLIRRDYAIKCLKMWDRPFHQLIDIPIIERTAELITRTNCLIAFPILAIEESVLPDVEKSSIRSNVGYNIQGFSIWDIDSFLAGELNDDVKTKFASKQKVSLKDNPGDQVTKKTTFRVITNYSSVQEQFANWLKMSKNNDGIWGSIKMVTDENADFTVIINHPRPGDKFIPEKTIVFQMEPESTRRRWGPTWSAPDSKYFFQVFDTPNHHNNIEWHLGKTYQELSTEKIVKSKNMSAIISRLNFLDGHRKRLAFVETLDAKISDFDLYGRDKFDLKSYQKPLPPNQKEEGLFPYRYTFAAENTQEVNYFTEKIVDAILSECLCFYSGCPNLKDYIDERAFVYIDLNNHDDSIALIQKCIEQDEWSKRINFIRSAKTKILNELQFMPTLEKLITYKNI